MKSKSEKLGGNLKRWVEGSKVTTRVDDILRQKRRTSWIMNEEVIEKNNNTQNIAAFRQREIKIPFSIQPAPFALFLLSLLLPLSPRSTPSALFTYCSWWWDGCRNVCLRHHYRHRPSHHHHLIQVESLSFEWSKSCFFYFRCRRMNARTDWSHHKQGQNQYDHDCIDLRSWIHPRFIISFFFNALSSRLSFLSCFPWFRLISSSSYLLARFILIFSHDVDDPGFDRSIPGYSRYSMTGNARDGVHNLRIEKARLEDDGEYQCQVGPGLNTKGIRTNSRLTVLRTFTFLRFCMIMIHFAPRGLSSIVVPFLPSLSTRGIWPNPISTSSISTLEPFIDSWSSSSSFLPLMNPRCADQLLLSLSYSCAVLATHRHPHDHPSRSHLIWMNPFGRSPVRPQTIDITGHTNGSTIEIRQEQSLNLECLVSGGKPAAQIKWFRKSVELRSGKSSPSSSSSLSPSSSCSSFEFWSSLSLPFTCLTSSISVQAVKQIRIRLPQIRSLMNPSSFPHAVTFFSPSLLTSLCES